MTPEQQAALEKYMPGALRWGRHAVYGRVIPRTRDRIDRDDVDSAIAHAATCAVLNWQPDMAANVRTFILHCVRLRVRRVLRNAVVKRRDRIGTATVTSVESLSGTGWQPVAPEDATDTAQESAALEAEALSLFREGSIQREVCESRIRGETPRQFRARTGVTPRRYHAALVRVRQVIAVLLQGEISERRKRNSVIHAEGYLDDRAGREAHASGAPDRN